MWEIVVAALLATLAGGLYWVIQPYLVWRRSAGAQQHAGNKLTIINTARQTCTLQEHLQSKASARVELSLVVPSYNQEQRIPIMLEQAIAYLTAHNIVYEIMVVNDGSKDKTTDAALATAQKHKANLFVIEYPRNRGKGGAVRAGVKASVGDRVLMVDADGATTFSELGKLNKQMDAIQGRVGHPLVMVVGSRNHLEQEAKVERKLHRKLVSAVFGFIKTIVCGVRTKDTQCGFKLFTRESARVLFNVLHIERWAFDIELFVVSNMSGVEIGQCPVEWKDVDGSKLNVIEASVNMFRDVVMISLLYALRLWKRTDQVIIQ